MIKKIITLSAIIAFIGVYAQKTHIVEKGDTAYNIAKRYGMSFNELIKLNPSAKEGKINIGDVLMIEPKKNVGIVAKTVSKSSEIGHIVLQPKQTIYGITKQYHISETQLRALNPDLDANMKIGNKVALPLELIKKYGGDQPVEIANVTTENMVGKITEATDENSYLVQPKDNYYRITRKFKITKEQLFALNPDLEQKGLQAGDVLKIKGEIPVETAKNDTKFSKLNNPVSDEYIEYKVKDGDTVFGIINKFGTTLDELLSLNPQLSNGLRAGMILKIKGGELSTTYVKRIGDALNVAILLPFGFNSNDSKYRSISSDFLTGAKLAIERNVGTGQKLNITVIDAGNENSFKNNLLKIDKNNTDLIIGPLFKSNVLEVLNYVSDKKIPVVAPFANSEDLYEYGNLVIVETSDNTYADRIVEEVKKIYSDQKIYILTDSDKTYAHYIKGNLEKNLKKTNIVVVNSASKIQLEKNMMTGQPVPIIAVLATKNEQLGSAFALKVMELSKEIQGMRTFSMYYHSSFEKYVDELSQANLVYLMDRKINTEGSFEKEILNAYKAKYCKTPSKYAIIGFDVMNDILSRENKKGEIFKQMNRVQTQLATKFEFVRAKRNGAYINTGYRVVRLVP